MISSFRFPLNKSFLVAAAFTASAVAAHAATIVKASNNDSLVSGSSWVGGVVPTAADIVKFDSTFSGSTSLVTGGPLSVSGVQVTNVGQLIGVNNGAGNYFGVGADGIDMSQATNNLVIKSLRVEASQTWNIAAGRTFRIGDVAATSGTNPRAGSLINHVPGSTVTVTGGGTVVLDLSDGQGGQIGDLNWYISNGLVQAIWNNNNAFGTGLITLAGGGIAAGTPIAGSQGNWTFGNNIALVAGTSSYIDNRIPAGSNRTLNLNGVISGAGNLEFRNTNRVESPNFTFVLNAANTYTGNTAIAEGATLRLNGNGRLGGGDYFGVISGGGSFIYNGNGAQILSGNHTYTGTTSITSGTVQVGAGGTSGALGSGAISVGSGASLIYNRSDVFATNYALTNAGTFGFSGSGSQTHSGVISGAGRVVKSGAGTLTLTGVNTYTGGTTINGGTLVLASGSYAGTTTLSGNGATLKLDYTDGTARFTGNSNLVLGAAGAGNGNTLELIGGAFNGQVTGTALNGNVTILRSSGTSTLNLGAISGGGVITLGGAGIVKTTSVNGASGFISAGVLLRSGGVTSFAANDGAGNLTLFTGTVGVERGGATLPAATDNTSVLSVNNGAGNGSGVITLGTTGVKDVNVILVATDATAGGGATAFDLTGGTLRMSAAGGITQLDSVAGALSFMGGSLTAGGADNTAGSITFANLSVSSDILVGSTIVDNGTGAVGVVKNGPGTVVFSEANTYTGATTIEGGTLRITGAGTLGTGTVTVGSAGSLVFNTTGSTEVSSVLAGSGAIRAQTGVVVLSAANTYTGTLTIDAGATVQVGNGGTTGALGTGALVNNGTLAYNRSDDVTIASALTGPGGFVQNGTGTVAFSTQKTYTGGTTVNAGILDLTGVGGAGGVIRGVATVNAGAMLRLSYGDATGYGTGSDRLHTINLNGGTLHVNTTSNQTLGNAVINMTGGHITGIAGSNLDFFAGSSALNTFASSETSTISGTFIGLRQASGIVFNVAQGTTASGVDLLVSSIIRNGNSANGPLIKQGAGTMELSGANTFSGGITLSGGTLLVSGSLAGNNISVAAGTTLKSTGMLYNAFSNNVVTLNGGTLELNSWDYETNVGVGSLGMLAATAERIVANTDSTIRVLGTTSYGRGITVNGNLTLETGADADWTINITRDNYNWIYNNNPTLTLAGDGVGRFDKVMANGTGGLVKNGAGTWTLGGANTFTGGTTVNDGTLVLGHATNTLADAGFVTVNGGELSLGTNSDTVGVVTLNDGAITADAESTGGLTGTAYNVVNGAISASLRGSAVLTKTGTGTVVLSGTNTYTGATNITSGMLVLGTGGTTGSLASGSAVNVDAGGTLAFDRSDLLNFSNVISGAGEIRQMGAGTTVLSGQNTFTGKTVVDAGVLRLQVAGARTGDGAIEVNGTGRFDANNFDIATGDLSGNGTLAMGSGDLTITTGSSRFDGVISGGGDITVDAGASLVLAGTSTATGTIRVNGDLTFGAGGATGSIGSSEIIVAAGSTLGFNRGDTAFNSTATIHGGGTLLGIGAGTVRLSGSVDDVAIANSGAGTLIVSNAVNVISVGNTAAANPTASTQVTASGSVGSILNEVGTVRVTAPVVTGTTVVNGGSVTAIADLQGAITIDGGTLTVGARQGDTVSKISSTTQINAGGTLVVATGVANTLTDVSGSGTIRVNTSDDSTVNLDLTSTFDGNVVLAGGSATIVDQANLGGATSLDFTGGTLVITGGGVQSLDIQVTAAAGTLSFIDFGTSTADVLNITLTPTGGGVIRNRGQGLINNAPFLPGQILDVFDPLDLYGADLTTNDFNDTLSIYNTGANATFIVNQNVDGVASGVFGGEVGGVSANDFNLVKNGNATLSLTAANTYTGTTVVNAGTLQIGNGGVTGNLGSGAVTINAGGTLAFNRTDDITVSNQISGAGVLAQYGTGVVTLTSDISVGGLGGTGEFHLANNILTVQSGTFAGVLSGSGKLVKETTGTLVLTGDSNLNSALDIRSGTVQFGNGGASGSLGAGEIINRGTFVINRSDSHVFANRISGVGAFTQAGSGTTILTSDNTYLGRTLVSAGVLQVGNGGTVGSLGSGSVAANGTLRFKRTDNISFTNTLTGTGVVEQAGPGRLTVTNGAGFTGVFRAAAGELVVSTASMPAASYHAVSGATVRLEATGNNTLTGDVSGAGDFILAGGSGTTTLNGVTSGTGKFIVESGRTLSFGTASGLLTPHIGSADMQIRYGASLKGSGSVAGNLTNAGTISPGYSPGHIRVGGDFTQTGTGVLNMEIYGNAGAGVAGGHDQISFAGVANFDGVLNITLMPGFTPTAGFSAVLFQDTDLTGGVSFVGDFATINVTGDNGAGRIVTSGSTIAYFAGTSIAQTSGLSLHDGVEAFANALSPSVGASHPELANFLAITDLEARAKALQNASPVGFAALTSTVVDQVGRETDGIRRRAENQARSTASLFGDEAEWLAYVGGTGGTVDHDTGSASPTFNTRTFGGYGAIERRLGDGSVAFGVRAGYNRATANLHNDGGKFDQDHARATFYGTGLIGEGGFITASVGMGHSSYDTKRNTIAGELTASPSGWDVSFGVDGGFVFKPNRYWSITPYAGLSVVHATVGGFSEEGNSLALAVDNYSHTAVRGRVGSTFMYERLAKGFTRDGIRFGLDVAFEQTLSGDKVDIPAGFVNYAPSGTFDSSAPALIKSSFVAGPQIDWTFGGTRTISAGYRYQYGFDGSTGQRVDISFEQRF